MALDWYWWLDIGYGVASIVLGTIAFALAPTRPVNRFLFLVLLIDGVAWIAFGTAIGGGRGYLPMSVPTVAGALAVNVVGFVILLPVYVLFVAYAAPVAWLAWMRSRRGRSVMLLSSLLLIPYGLVTFNAVVSDSAGATLFLLLDALLFVAVYTVCVAAAFQFMRGQVRGTVRHGAARLVFLAVLLRDLPWITLQPLSILFSAFSSIPEATITDLRELLWVPFLVGYLTTAVLGILRGQLVDVDRKLHITISRTTVAAIFIAVFVGVQTFISEYFTNTAGLAAGAIAASTLVFAMAPLQRMADRVADKAVPRGGNRGLSGAEREAFYREQVEIAYSDGVIGPKERAALRSVRERLGLSGDAALRIEDAVVG